MGEIGLDHVELIKIGEQRIAAWVHTSTSVPSRMCLHSSICHARQHGTKRLWLKRIICRRPTKVAAVAVANEITRMTWAILVRSQRYKEPTPIAGSVN